MTGKTQTSGVVIADSACTAARQNIWNKVILTIACYRMETHLAAQ